MTRTARYNATTNSLQELPMMGKPICINGVSPNLCSSIRKNMNLKECECKEYYDHLASLREIPCHESCKGVFIHDCDYEEGRDYKVYQYEDRLILAYPISKDGEDELWEKIFLFMHKGAQGYKIISGINHPGLPNDKTWHEDMISELKKYFTLTPR